MSSEKLRIKIAVIGGGIGGLCVAIHLLKFPHLDVQVYEAAHKFSEIGAGVAFGPNAARAMKCIDDSIHDAFLSQVTGNSPECENDWFTFHFGTGPHAGDEIARVINETGQTTVHRAKFLDELVKLVPAGIAHFGKRLDRLVETEDEVQLHFLDGTTASAQCVIGADGVHSVIRKHLLGADHPATDAVFTGAVAYRGLVPMDKAVASMGERIARNSHIWSGHGGGFMIYPIDHGVTMNVVAINSSVKSWKGAWVQKVTVDQVKSEFEGWSELPQKILALLDPNDTSAWSMWDMLPAPTYAKGRIVMMGDAAHASTPWQGQGAGQAIEDALVLGHQIGTVGSLKDIPIALQAYDRVRRPRSQKVCTTSREAGEMNSLRLPGVMDSAEEFRKNVEWRMEWIWHRDIQGECTESDVWFKFLKREQSATQ
ncbi:hypothetical protein F5Y16DRAFT_199247 [Xylariaceae sp. FL0255]|nr:hypothetical protein F5Y16DRAFT_199247 [Xylariaceae sp. FL0255]